MFLHAGVPPSIRRCRASRQEHWFTKRVRGGPSRLKRTSQRALLALGLTGSDTRPGDGVHDTGEHSEDEQTGGALCAGRGYTTESIRRATSSALPAAEGGFGPVISVEDMVRTLTYSTDPVWELIRREAEIGAGNEPQLASSLYATVLNHRCLEDTLAFHLANELASPFFQATQYVKLFRDALYQEESYREAIRADLLAVVRRDPAMKHCVAVLMYNKGFAALQAYRLAHWLWRQDRKVLALFLQSEISKSFAVDIHPAARIGSGVLVDHATGIVIGETAVVGDDVSMLHNVTLGGTGKEAGDRHPKVGRGVLLGAGATVLGNIRIGDGAQITASSVVLKDVAPYAIVNGVPAREIGKLSYPKGVYPAFEMDQRAAAAARARANGQYRQVVEEPLSSVDWYLGDSI
ncbi:hypothetical protein CCYA_CCYA20G4043 [Cyanidiococcus yangmingshanensis]|nr:hypothetical protein CCYA_CCYA20G4043 [Cyanidiococcus yangmingshanensis]